MIKPRHRPHSRAVRHVSQETEAARTVRLTAAAAPSAKIKPFAKGGSSAPTDAVIAAAARNIPLPIRPIEALTTA